MAYPTFKQRQDSRCVRLDGLILDEGGDLTAWVRNMAPTDKFTFRVVHVLIQSQLDTLTTFYLANKTTPFDFVFRDNTAVTYTNCIFIKSPQKVENHARGLFTVVVELRTK